MQDERRLAADENLAAVFALARRHHAGVPGGARRFGAVDAIATGIAVGYFNPVLALRPESALADIHAAITWIDELGLPVTVQVGADLDAQLQPGLEALGFVAGAWQLPVMVLDPIPPGPPPLPGVTIRTGRGELFDDWHTALATSEPVRPLFGPGLLNDQDVLLTVGYLEGAAVSCAAAIRSGSTVGIYAVGTLEHARRRGIGRAVTWAVIEAGRSAWSGTIAILQSSELGLSVYRSMGFEEVTRYALYSRPGS